ncbi:hypothetical protein D3OALGA1CA_5090 [Olavius algarvensis associated proteobacterium Delta 3]|nr:hypothetical protein D3OALGA1CA_5090 [Olavius algarvensis associated proteobacterium Delta 3]
MEEQIRARQVAEALETLGISVEALKIFSGELATSCEGGSCKYRCITCMNGSSTGGIVARTSPDAPEILEALIALLKR